MTKWGYAITHRAEDGTFWVEHADPVIGVTAELWDNLAPGLRQDDGTLYLDTAGEYHYRQIGHNLGHEVLIFERIGTP